MFVFFLVIFINFIYFNSIWFEKLDVLEKLPFFFLNLSALKHFPGNHWHNQHNKHILRIFHLLTLIVYTECDHVFYFKNKKNFHPWTWNVVRHFGFSLQPFTHSVECEIWTLPVEVVNHRHNAHNFQILCLVIIWNHGKIVCSFLFLLFVCAFVFPFE